MEKPKTRNRGPKYGPRVMIGGHFHPDVQFQLRAIAREEGTSLQQLLIEALNYIFKTRNLPRIAGEMPKPEEK